MFFPLFFPSSHFALYWGTLAIKKVDAFIPSEDSVSSCWAVFPWLFERVRLLPIASWTHTKNVQVERDLEDHQSSLPVTDKAIDPRSVKSQDLSRLTWPISASLEKNLPFLVSQCWALKKKKRRGTWLLWPVIDTAWESAVPVCLARLITAWRFSLEPSWTHHAFAQENQIKEPLISQLPCACSIQRRGAGNGGGKRRKHLSFNTGLTWKLHCRAFWEPR